MRRDDVGEQRLADRVFVDREFARFDCGEQHFFFARSFLFQTAFDRREHRGFFEHDDAVW